MQQCRQKNQWWFRQREHDVVEEVCVVCSVFITEQSGVQWSKTSGYYADPAFADILQ